ncbi:MAG: HEAT repeat domain-containing protein [Clostridiaceae bacterium]|nr:HEAT repeat domain-containing protein [Clostridiaceae bacterium]
MFSFFKKKSSEHKNQPAADSHDPADTAYLKEPLAALKDHRREVFDAVGRIRCTDNETKILSGEFVRKYSAIAKALADSKDPSAVEPLKSALEEQLSAYEKFCYNAENAPGPHDYFIKEWKWDTAVAMIDALGAFGDKCTVEVLSTCLNSTHSELRKASAEALGNLNVPKSLEILKNHLSDEDPSVRIASAASLQKLGDPKWAGLIKGSADDFLLLQSQEESKEELLRNLCDSLNISNSNSRCYAVENLIRDWGNTGFRVLLLALQSSNDNIFDAGAWGFTYTPMIYYKRKLESRQAESQKEAVPEKRDDAAAKLRELSEIIREAAVCMTEIIRNAQLKSDAYNYYDDRTIRALNFLRQFGDPDALPALKLLLNEAAKKREKDGFKKTYFQTSEYGGWIDNDSAVKTVQDVIDAIGETAKK